MKNVFCFVVCLYFSLLGAAWLIGLMDKNIVYYWDDKGYRKCAVRDEQGLLQEKKELKDCKSN